MMFYYGSLHEKSVGHQVVLAISLYGVYTESILNFASLENIFLRVEYVAIVIRPPSCLKVHYHFVFIGKVATLMEAPSKKWLGCENQCLLSWTPISMFTYLHHNIKIYIVSALPHKNRAFNCWFPPWVGLTLVGAVRLWACWLQSTLPLTPQ